MVNNATTACVGMMKVIQILDIKVKQKFSELQKLSQEIHSFQLLKPVFIISNANRLTCLLIRLTSP